MAGYVVLFAIDLPEGFIGLSRKLQVETMEQMVRKKTQALKLWREQEGFTARLTLPDGPTNLGTIYIETDDPMVIEKLRRLPYIKAVIKDQLLNPIE